MSVPDVASRACAVRIDRRLIDDSNHRLGQHSEPLIRAVMNTMG